MHLYTFARLFIHTVLLDFKVVSNSASFFYCEINKNGRVIFIS